jgi:hypothetical protein
MWRRTLAHAIYAYERSSAPFVALVESCIRCGAQEFHQSISGSFSARLLKNSAAVSVTPTFCATADAID